LGSHHHLGVAAADPDRLLHAGDAGTGEGERDLRRRRLQIVDGSGHFCHGSNASSVLTAARSGAVRRYPPRSPETCVSNRLRIVSASRLDVAWIASTSRLVTGPITST